MLNKLIINRFTNINSKKFYYSSFFSDIHYNTLVDLHKYSCNKYANNIAFKERDNSNIWKSMTYKEFEKNVEKCRGFLYNSGIRNGDKVGCISNNSINVATLMYATYSLGAIYVGMYEKQLKKDWDYIIRDSNIKLLCVSNNKIYKNIESLNTNISELYSFEPNSILTYKDFIAKQESIKSPLILPDKDTIANIIYTSGTTAKPRGVELTHNNIVSNIMNVKKILPKNFITEKDTTLSYIPFSHSYGNTVELHGMLSYGGCIAIVKDVDNISEDLKEIKPTILFSVPLLMNKVYYNVQKKFNNSNKLKQYLFNKALEYNNNKTSIDYKFLNYYILSKIRNIFGGNLRYIFSAGSACDKKIIEFFDKIGIPIYQGYGLTETSPIISLCTDENYLKGSVGKVINNCSVKICKDDIPVKNNIIGEVCVYGENIFKQYHNNIKLTEDSFINIIDEFYDHPSLNKRYFKTGDIGYLDDDNNLFITGRTKELYKLSNGRYIIPSIIENELKKSVYIKEVVLYGSNKEYNIALIVPNLDNLYNYLKESNKKIKNVTFELIQNNKVIINLLNSEIKKYTQKCKKFEIPHKFYLLEESFTIENGLLTQKLSIKRHKVYERYKKEIKNLYI